MSPAIDNALAAIRPITRLLGIVLVLSAGAHMFGFTFGMHGDTSSLALVGLGLLHV